MSCDGRRLAGVEDGESIRTDRIGHHLHKFIEAELAIAVLIRLHDRFVDDLLQLTVFKIVAHHHLQHQEQLPIANVVVPVHIIHFECD